jgi:hypothetical protein
MRQPCSWVEPDSAARDRHKVPDISDKAPPCAASSETGRPGDNRSRPTSHSSSVHAGISAAGRLAQAVDARPRILPAPELHRGGRQSQARRRLVPARPPESGARARMNSRSTNPREPRVPRGHASDSQDQGTAPVQGAAWRWCGLPRTSSLVCPTYRRSAATARGRLKADRRRSSAATPGHGRR